MNLTTTAFVGVLSFQFVGCHLIGFRSMVIKFSQKSDVWAFMSKDLHECYSLLHFSMISYTSGGHMSSNIIISRSYNYIITRS